MLSQKAQELITAYFNQSPENADLKNRLKQIEIELGQEILAMLENFPQGESLVNMVAHVRNGIMFYVNVLQPPYAKCEKFSLVLDRALYWAELNFHIHTTELQWAHLAAIIPLAHGEAESILTTQLLGIQIDLADCYEQLGRLNKKTREGRKQSIEIYRRILKQYPGNANALIGMLLHRNIQTLNSINDLPEVLRSLDMNIGTVGLVNRGKAKQTIKIRQRYDLINFLVENCADRDEKDRAHILHHSIRLKMAIQKNCAWGVLRASNGKTTLEELFSLDPVYFNSKENLVIATALAQQLSPTTWLDFSVVAYGYDFGDYSETQNAIALLPRNMAVYKLVAFLMRSIVASYEELAPTHYLKIKQYEMLSWLMVTHEVFVNHVQKYMELIHVHLQQPFYVMHPASGVHAVVSAGGYAPPVVSNFTHGASAASSSSAQFSMDFKY